MLSMLRRQGLCARTGKSMSSNYRDIGNGLLTASLAIGERAVGWPDFEIEAINQARLQGKSNDEIRVLVSLLMKARTTSEIAVDAVLGELTAPSNREAISTASHRGEEVAP